MVGTGKARATGTATAVSALPTSISGALQRFAESVRGLYGERVSEIVLFGSWARGDAHEESDVDVLVLIDALAEEEITPVIDLAVRINQSSDPWIGLMPLILSSEQAAELRTRGRMLWRDIEAEGVPL